MLVLARKRNETLIIGDDISITVVDIRGDQVRLGIEAPKDVSVHRQEVYDAIKRAEKPGRPLDAAVAQTKKDSDERQPES